MKNETLLDKAIQNYNCARAIYESELMQDEAYLNYVGYHLQQTVELSIKYFLEQNGVEYPKTHDITQLISLSKDNDTELFISDYIEEHSEMFTMWESKTRYVLNYKLEFKKIDKAIKEVEEYLDTIIGKQKVCEENLDNKLQNDNEEDEEFDM